MVKELSLKSLDKDMDSLENKIDGELDNIGEDKSKLATSINSRGITGVRSLGSYDKSTKKVTVDPQAVKYDDFKPHLSNLNPIMTSQSAPSNPPRALEITDSSIRVEVRNTGAKIRFGNQVVSSPYTFEGLEDDTEYTFYAFYPENEKEFLSESPNSVPLKVRTNVAFDVSYLAAKTPGSAKPVSKGTTTGTNYGTSTHAYYGKVQGLITGDELISKAGVTQGTTRISGDITWLKFEHNGKVLFVANDHIKNEISWDHLEEKRVVRGKVIDIDGTKYLLRLLHGSAINPTKSDSINDTIRLGNEWDDLIVKYTPDNSDSNWSGIYSWCQEVGESNNYRVRRGNYSIANFHTDHSYNTNSNTVWRPVLEVL